MTYYAENSIVDEEIVAKVQSIVFFCQFHKLGQSESNQAHVRSEFGSHDRKINNGTVWLGSIQSCSSSIPLVI